MAGKYLTAKELGITPLTRKYLIYAAKTLPKLAKPQKLNGGTFGFNMDIVLDDGGMPDFRGRECGTAGCILGLMMYKAKLDGLADHVVDYEFDASPLGGLFYSYPSGTTNKTAAAAAEGFLKTGEVRWAKPKKRLAVS